MSVFSFSLTASASQLLFNNVSVKAANVTKDATGTTLNVTSRVSAPSVFGSVGHFIQDHVGLDAYAVGKLAGRVLTTTTPEGRALKAAVLASGFALGSTVTDSNGFHKPSSISKPVSYSGTWLHSGVVVDPVTYMETHATYSNVPVTLTGITKNGTTGSSYKFTGYQPNPTYPSIHVSTHSYFTLCVAGTGGACPAGSAMSPSKAVSPGGTGPSALGALVNRSSSVRQKLNNALAATPAISKSNPSVQKWLQSTQANIDSAKPATSGGTPTTSNLNNQLRTSSTAPPSGTPSGGGGSATLPGKNTIIPSKPSLSNSTITVPGLSGAGTHLSKTCGTPWKTSVSLNNQTDPVSIPMKPFCQMASSLAPFVHAAALIGGIVIVAGGL